MKKSTYDNKLIDLLDLIPINKNIFITCIKGLQGSNYLWELKTTGANGTLETGANRLGFYINFSWTPEKLIMDYLDRPRGYSGRDEYDFSSNKWN